MRAPAILLASLLVAAPTGCGDETRSLPPPDPEPKPDLGTVDDIMSSLPQSCAFACGQCEEPTTPYACPTLKPWDDLPHDSLCEAWDGTFPAPGAGECVASEPTLAAAQKAGPIPGGFVLPDGHRIVPAGREWLFSEPDLEGGFPMNILAVPGERIALVSDGGLKDNALRVIDLDALAGAGDPVKSHVGFPPPSALYYGLAWLSPGRALASGGGDGVIYAFDVDLVTGAVVRAPARDLPLGTAGVKAWYAGAIATTADGARLLVAPSQYAEEIAILSLADADYGKKLGAVPVTGSHAIFDLQRDPFDPSGTTFYATDQMGSRLFEIDAVSAAVTRTIALQKSPAQIAFLDATYLVVAEAHSDSIAVINRAIGMVEARVPVFDPTAPRGFSPSALAYDPAKKRLYAALAGVNAVEVYDILPGAPPTITPAGRISTGWWPTGVIVDSDGSLIILSGKGHGAGTDGKPYSFGNGPITARMRGGVQHVPAASLTNLAVFSAAVEEGRNLGEQKGRPEVTCPSGTDDFPIPVTNQSGPSKVIKHVILVVRENKTYDALFGDRPDLGDGDPKLIMAGDPALQAAIWQNARAIAAAFTNFDNFYTDAEQSIQGHIWTTYGRTNDYVERTWLTTWGRASRPPTEANTSLQSEPLEGSVFRWLDENSIDYDNMGEIIGGASKGLDGAYPGLVNAQNVPDVDKSCYMAGRIRLRCDLAPFTYALQSNDHTFGGQAGAAAPEVMIAVNDEASGMLLDALSRSPRWKDTLLLITEDDPQDGGDHVDLHRSILLMASPWVRRGYVSHGHYDMASVYKLIAHIYGIPYHNESIRSALLPLDAFTSTPDYTSFTYLPRRVDAPCNAAGSMEAREAEGWDFSDVDEQPGLSQQIMRMLKAPRGERPVRLRF